MESEKRRLTLKVLLFVIMFFCLSGFDNLSDTHMEKMGETSKNNHIPEEYINNSPSASVYRYIYRLGSEQDDLQQKKQSTNTLVPDQNSDFHLPFEDNFDNGLRKEWILKSKDEPLLTNGMLTAKSRKEVSLEIGNTELNNYALEFDVFYDYHEGGASITFFMNSKLKMVASPRIFNPTRLTWYEFDDNKWQMLDKQDTTLFSKESERWKISRNGDKYQIFRNGEVINTFQYGSETGDPMMMQIKSNEILIDNFSIRELTDD